MRHSIEVVKAGPLSTVQDRGRIGVQHLGFSPSGAADTYALAVGNRLLDNDQALAAVEMTLGGANFRFHAAATIAVTGAAAAVSLDGQPLTMWRTHAVPAGALLRVGAATRGVRNYLCVAGGIDVPPVYGSRATDLLAGIGGVEGRALRAGDHLPIGPAPALPAARLAALARPLYQRLILVRVVPGPQDSAFTRQSRETFFASPYRVSPRADRTGLFLEGPRLFHEHSADILSEGVTAGSIQVPATGQPLILLAEHRGIGGYPKIGTVCRADLPLLAQARPGDVVLCVPVTHAEARQAYVAMEQLKAETLAPADDGGATVAATVDSREAVAATVDDGRAADRTVEEWLGAIEAAALAALADERLPLLRSDLDRLCALIRGDVAPAGAAHTLRLSGQVIVPSGAAESARTVRAPTGGTLLIVEGEQRNLPIGAVAAAIWSPGAWTLLAAGYPLARLTPLCGLGTHVKAGAALFHARFPPHRSGS